MKAKLRSLAPKCERYAPPGYDWKGEFKWLIIALILAFCWTAGYIFRLTTFLEQLYIVDYMGIRKLKSGAEMIPFIYLPVNSFKGFTVFAVLMIVAALLRYMYFFQGSRSIYTMRRLPKRSETWKRCILTPLMWVFICAVTAFIVLAIDFAIYIVATPKACLPAGQLGITLRNLAEVFI